MNIAISIISVLPWIRASECAHTRHKAHTNTPTRCDQSFSPAPPTPEQPQSGLLQSSVVSLYTTYILWSALSNEPYGPDQGWCPCTHACTATYTYMCTPSVGPDTSTPPLAAQSATSPTVLAGSCPRVAMSWQCPSLASSSCSSRSPTSGKSPAPPHPSLGG